LLKTQLANKSNRELEEAKAEGISLPLTLKVKRLQNVILEQASRFSGQISVFERLGANLQTRVQDVEASQDANTKMVID
jgi:hypothetical protein